MMSKKTLQTLCACALACLLAACGGGGSDSSSSTSAPTSSATTLQYSPATLTATYHAGMQPVGSIKVTAVNPPSTSVYIKLTVSQNIFATLPSVSGSNGSYNVSYVLSNTVPPGTYDGNIAVTLCQDPACNSPLPSSIAPLPYHIVVEPGLQIGVVVNGVPMAGSDGSFTIKASQSLTVPRGATVVVSSNVASDFISSYYTNVAWTVPYLNVMSETLQFTANTTGSDHLEVIGDLTAGNDGYSPVQLTFTTP